MPLLECGHEEDSEEWRVCSHLCEADDEAEDEARMPAFLRYTGIGIESCYVCTACDNDRDLRVRSVLNVCADCSFDALRHCQMKGFSGAPQIAERRSSLHFVH